MIWAIGTEPIVGGNGLLNRQIGDWNAALRCPCRACRHHRGGVRPGSRQSHRHRSCRSGLPAAGGAAAQQRNIRNLFDETCYTGAINSTTIGVGQPRALLIGVNFSL